MFKRLFKHINIDMNNVHFPSARTLEGKYEELINETGGVDLTILGVGVNGHIAFNEPGTPINSMTHVVTLDEITRQANARFFSNNITDVPSEAVSCGLDTILQSKQIVLVASGKNKNDAIDHLRHAKTFNPK
jgi:glucosamine-6-phosphate deaminase